ncbi:MAG: cell envelope integrity protein TolA [Nevskia sp.]|nr:cell envelope integrity protein TolA [Nevskia sp.]
MKLQTRHIVAAFALHLAVFGLLFSGVQCGRVPEPVSIIQGTLISANELPKPNAAPKPEPAPEPPAPEPVKPETPPETPPTPPKPDPAEAQRKQQQEQEAKQQQKAAEQKATELKTAQEALLKKQAVELADKKKLAEDAKKKKESEDQQRQEDLARSTIEEEEKRLTAEKKKKAEQTKREAEAKRALEAELASAMGAETAERTAQDASIWGTQLVAAIQRVWTYPPGTADQGLNCVINMQLSATGEVLAARIQKSSGNGLFDDSVVRAVYKASPMPLPRDPRAFQAGINITFKPR